ncbi:aspartate/glutamate racemase family protein [Ectothiorhodospiraceae bacterium 2226]|nr:aspartate/glutamate racemase family protein [Ectothiorhodospiraceae bacterium 2226]
MGDEARAAWAAPVARRRLGIITGAGPEAGLDLWSKMLAANRAMLGAAYRGDLDAPDVTVFSVPELGLAMDLEGNEERLWEVLRQTLLTMDAAGVDLFCIACNALHYYADRIADLQLNARFVSIVDAVRAYLQAEGVEEAAILSISRVMALDRWSAYTPLARDVRLETPEEPALLDEIIQCVKRYGPQRAETFGKFARVLEGLRAPVVLLACTELPLIPTTQRDKTLVDVTAVLARTMVKASLSAPDVESVGEGGL